MITRHHPPEPAWFSTNEKTIRRKQAIERWSNDPSQSLYVRWVWQEIDGFMKRFQPLFDHKCIYCESHLTDASQARVDFFRPYEWARQSRDAKAPVDKHHYRWLSWQWSNLYLVCALCAATKESLFPTLNQRRLAPGQLVGGSSDEQIVLLDPCDSETNPLRHLLFQEDGTVVSQSNSAPDRGAVTIEILGLNRPSLVQARFAAATALQQQWQAMLHTAQRGDREGLEAQIAQLQAACSDSAEFAGLKRQLLFRWQQGAIEQPTEVWQHFVNELRRWNGPGTRRVAKPKRVLSGSARFEQGYALLIGVGTNAYDPALSLPITVNDAQALNEILSDEHYCAYPGAQIKLLCNDAATRQGILDGLNWLAEQATQPNATAFIFFSGHGAREKAGDHYFLLPHDYRDNRPYETALSAHDFYRAVQAIPARKTLVILDCCHAGGIARGKMAITKGVSGDQLRRAAPPQEFIQLLKEGEGRAIISSSRDGELSYIKVGDKNSLFTSELINALKGHRPHNKRATNPRTKPMVWLFDLLSYLSERVPKRAQEIAVTQTPVFDSSNVTDFPIAMLGGRRAGRGTRKD